MWMATQSMDETRWEAWLRPQTTSQQQQEEASIDGYIGVGDDRIGTALSTRSTRKRIISSTSAVSHHSCFVMLSSLLRGVHWRLETLIISLESIYCPVLSCLAASVSRGLPQ